MQMIFNIVIGVLVAGLTWGRIRAWLRNNLEP